ncbi:serine hydrolase domain-containing protein [Jiangella anatolica]|uniref:Serine hydrolase n=1 Tax=Jiangella anatolica TaxID=2670374 RepID=A0A2W2B3B9_9ACTN|nr:serine hydrolase domain-containing protein [Jiangella anatolica]PZF81941.1 serine hydrolase [Jiangella anatolica]
MRLTTVRLSRRAVLRGSAAAATGLAASAFSISPRAWPGEDSGTGPEGLQQALDGLVGTAADPADQPVAALGMVRDGGELWRGAAGYADRDAQRLAHPAIDYRFRIGSATKTFTATIVLQLVGEGRIGLDDPIGRQLPGLVPGEDRITVRSLLNMTSGLPDFLPILLPSLRHGISSYEEYRRASFRPIEPRDVIGQAVAAGPRFEAGTAFDYSTTNYLVLGLLIEQVTGRPYRTVLHHRIIRRLRLLQTDLPAGPALRPPYLHGYAHFHDLAEQWTDVTRRFEPGWSGGGMVSTLADLSRFFSALLSGDLLRPDLLDAMTTTSGAPPAASGAPPGAPDGGTYGLGLQRDDRSLRHPTWGHGGDTHGYNNRVHTTADGAAQLLAATTGFPARTPRHGPPYEPFIDAAFAAIGS